MRGLQARFVHRALDRVGDQGVADLSFEARPARVAYEGRGEHLVTALEIRQHELPGPPGVREAVQAYERRPGSATVRWGEDGVQMPKASDRILARHYPAG
jgi:hypothetical protein